MVFITLVCGYLSSTLLKINAEQIIKLSSQNLGKSFALIAAGEARHSRPKSPVPTSGLSLVGGERGLPGRGGRSVLGARGIRSLTMGRARPDLGLGGRMGRTFPEAKRLCLPGAGSGMFEGGSAGASSSSYAHRQTHRDSCKIHIHTHTHSLTEAHSLLSVAGSWCLLSGPRRALSQA